jgi:energy-coupling factor transporter ATP-binding protein EcfA2
MSTGARSLAMPYPGLRPFEEEDHPLFFGREVQVNSTLRQLEDQAFLAVVGSSGSGKSSFVRAGLLPAVREGFLLRTTDWLVLVSKPGHKPYENLALALAAAIRPGNGATAGQGSAGPLLPEQGRVLAALRRSDRGMLAALGECGIPADTRVMVVVDQFEELFAFRRATAQSDPVAPRDEAAAFVRMLLRSCPDPQSRIRVVLTLRSDFIGDCEAFLGLPEAVSRNQFLVPRLDRGQMEEVITRPAAVQDAGFRPFTFEEGLVNRIINDAGDRSDQLPLMQHALMRTWKFAVGRSDTDASPVRLGNEDYANAGGIENALSHHADAAWDEIKDDQRLAHIARLLFLLLCDVSPDGQISRRRPRVEEVEAVTGASLTEIENVRRVFQEDDRNFLLPPAQQRLASATLLDISHESLIRQWKRFNGWVEEERTSSAMLTRLRDAAMRWPKEEPPLRDPALAVALSWREQQCPSHQWAERYGGGLDRVLEYLEESRNEQRRDKDEKSAAQRRELEEAQRHAAEQAANARRFRNAALALIVVSIGAVVAAGYAIRKKNEVVALSHNLTQLRAAKTQLDADIGALDVERKAVEARKLKLEKFRTALYAIAGGDGFVRPADSETVAITFQPSEASPDTVISLLSGVGKVGALNLSGTKITDAALAQLKELPDLKSLDLSATDITNQGIDHISEMSQLTHLVLNDTMITEAALPLLEKLVNLKTLDLSHNRINQASVGQLRRKLPDCSVSYTPDPLLDALSRYRGNWDKALAVVKGSKRGDEVTFSGSPITDSALKALVQYHAIYLQRCDNLTNDGLKFLLRNNGLTHLTLESDSQISDKGVESLAGFKGLQSLTIESIAITDQGLAAVSQMRGLTRLVITGTNLKAFTDVGVGRLTSLTKLENLTLDFSDITDASLQAISRIPSLRSIEFKGNLGVSAAGYASLSKLPLLRALTIGFVGMRDADLKNFDRFLQLDTLIFINCPLTGKGVDSLRGVLPNTKVLSN